MNTLKQKFSLVILILPLVLTFFKTNLFPTNEINIESEEEYSQIYAKAEKFRLEGEFEKSIEFFEKALSYAEKMYDEKKQCELFLKLGTLYWNISETKDSKKKYAQALNLSQESNFKDIEYKSQKFLEIIRLYEEGRDFRKAQEYQKSIESFEAAVSLSNQLESEDHIPRCLRQLWGIYWSLGDLNNFKRKNEEALKIAQVLKHKEYEFDCLYNLGICYLSLDNYFKALRSYEDALKIIQLSKNKELESNCLNNIGIIYQKLGDYDNAIEHLTNALEIDLSLKDDAYIAMVYNNLGETYRNKGLTYDSKIDFHSANGYFNKALMMVEKALMQARKAKDEKKEIEILGTEIEILNNMGSVCTDLENYPEALLHFQTAYKKAEEIQHNRAMGMTLNNMSIVHYNLANYQTSTKYSERAIKKALEIGLGRILWEAYLENGKGYEKQKNFVKAIQSYKDSIDITENIRSSIALEELKAKYLGTEKRIEAYHKLINLLVKLHESDPEKEYNFKAFEYLERAKARAFLDSIELSQVDISQGVDPKLLNREKDLEKAIAEVYTKLLTVGLPREEIEKLREQREAYESESNALKREIREKSPGYVSLKYPEIIKINEIQDKLDSKTAFFAYCISKNKKDNSYAFVVTKKDLRIFPIPSREEIQKLVSDYLKTISDREIQDFHLGHVLYSNLVRPGLDKNIKKIIFIPDDILHYLPFETLISDRDTNRWFIKDFNIAYSPSISSLREIIKRKNSNNHHSKMDILAFGDPDFGSFETEENGEDIFQDFFSSSAFNFYRLEFSGIEIDKIGTLFKKKNTFRRESASEDQLKGLSLKDFKIIHFATHSIIDEKFPARSSIVLTLDNDPNEDGFLQMREIINLNLNADLVTLSSCQTGLGQFLHGEGIEGINRAFFFAGASSVLMSLWAVNDEASYQLMERFYYHLHSSESIMGALRRAKLEMINSDVLSHPYYWAGFIASGKADEIIFPGSKSKWIFLGGALILIFGVTVFVLQKKARRRL